MILLLGSMPLAINVAAVSRILFLKSSLSCLMVIADVPFSIAITDAIVEPILNGFWYYILDRYWASRVTSSA